jgi:uncharacterized protein YjbI with pentapeptide repeats
MDRFGANYRYADLSYIPLRGENLKKAKFMHADLVDADLSGADLRDATLTGADLRGTNLTGADLTGANLTGVLVDSLTILPAGYAVEDGKVAMIG